MTDVSTEALMVIGAAACALPLYAAIGCVLHRMRALERRFADASVLSRYAGEACAQWRAELAALEADGRAGCPKADALRRRLRETCPELRRRIGGNDGLPGA